MATYKSNLPGLELVRAGFVSIVHDSAHYIDKAIVFTDKACATKLLMCFELRCLKYRIKSN